MTDGERIKSARKAANMTQQELAAKMGVSFTLISQYERGVRNPKIEQKTKIAAALGCSVDYLIGWANDPNAPGGPDPLTVANRYIPRVEPFATEKYGVTEIWGDSPYVTYYDRETWEPYSFDQLPVEAQYVFYDNRWVSPIGRPPKPGPHPPFEPHKNKAGAPNVPEN